MACTGGCCCGVRLFTERAWRGLWGKAGGRDCVALRGLSGSRGSRSSALASVAGSVGATCCRSLRAAPFPSAVAAICFLSGVAASDGCVRDRSEPLIDWYTPGLSGNSVTRCAPPTPNWIACLSERCVRKKKPTPKNTPTTQTAITPNQTR
jgi:hypothetical protein